jgi:serine/threonine-protein kinase
MVVGTAQYLSPEQAQGFEVTAASDVYSLGRGRLRVPDRRAALRRDVAGRGGAGAHQPPAAAAAGERPARGAAADRACAGQGPGRPLPRRRRLRRRRPVGGLRERAGRRPAGRRAGDVTVGSPRSRPDRADRGRRRPRRLPHPGCWAPPPRGAPRHRGRTSVGAMPPLRRPTGGRRRAPVRTHGDDGGRRNRWVWLVAGLLVLALLGGGLWALLGPDGAESSSTGADPTASVPTTAAAPAPGTVLVDSTSYVGQNVDDVEQLLTGQGLQVDTEEASGAQLAALGRALDEGDVVTTDPFGQAVPLGLHRHPLLRARGLRPGHRRGGHRDRGGRGPCREEHPRRRPPRRPGRPRPAPTPTRANTRRPSAPASRTSSAPAAPTPSAPDDDEEGGQREPGTRRPNRRPSRSRARSAAPRGLGRRRPSRAQAAAADTGAAG